MPSYWPFSKPAFGTATMSLPGLEVLRSEKRFAIVTLALHGVLVVFHAFLFLVMWFELERHITVHVGRATSVLALLGTTVLQIIGTLYTSLLVWVTQQQALHRDFHSRPVLTALHDQTTAWLGLGSSLNMIYRQRQLRTALGPILLISMYLAGIFGIHITTPVLFSLRNITQEQMPYSRYGALYVADNAQENDVPFDRASEVLGIFTPGSINASALPGLINDKLYDIPVDTDSAKDEGTASFNATQFRFSCGMVPNATFVNTTMAYNQLHHTVDVSPEIGTVMLPGSLNSSEVVILQGSDRWFPLWWTWSDFTNHSNPSSSWIIATRLNVTDNAVYAASSDSTQSTPPPPTNSVPPVSTYSPSFSGEDREQPVRLLACRLYTLDGAIRTTYPGRKVLNPQESFDVGDISVNQFGSQLRNWTYSQSRSPQQANDRIRWLTGFITPLVPKVDTNSCQLPALDSYGPPPAPTPEDNVEYYCYEPNGLELYVNNCLNINRAAGVFQEHSTFAVGGLENCLSQAAALLAWQGRNIQYIDLAKSGHPAKDWLGKYDVYPWRPLSQLHLNIVPLLSGLGISVAILVIAFFLTWPRGTTTVLHRELTNPGVLQIAWLAGRQPDFAQRIAQVKEPTQQALREAGVFRLQWNEAVHSSSNLIRAESYNSGDVVERKTRPGEDDESEVMQAVPSLMYSDGQRV